MLGEILASEMVWSRLVKWLLLRLIELYRRDASTAMPNFWAYQGTVVRNQKSKSDF
jgi:hypothetical protein